jgi:hypothetical protein
VAAVCGAIVDEAQSDSEQPTKREVHVDVGSARSAALILFFQARVSPLQAQGILVESRGVPYIDEGIGITRPEANRVLGEEPIRILEASDEDRAAAIGRLHLRDDGALLEDLLMELEEKEWARQAAIEELRRTRS